MINPDEWDFMDAHFGSNGLPGTYVEVTVSSNSGRNIHVNGVAIKVCYMPREYLWELNDASIFIMMKI